MRCSMQLFPEWRKIPWLRVRKLVAWQKLFLIKNRYARENCSFRWLLRQLGRGGGSRVAEPAPSHRTRTKLYSLDTSRQICGAIREKNPEKIAPNKKQSGKAHIPTSSVNQMQNHWFWALFHACGLSRQYRYMDIFLFRTLKTDCAWPDCPN